MNTRKNRAMDLQDNEQEPYLTYANIKIKVAKKVKPNEKPRLYRKVQQTLAGIKSSLAEDIIKERIES